MVHRDVMIAYIENKNGFRRTLKNALQLIDELVCDSEPTTSEVKPSTPSSEVDPSTTPETPKFFKHGNSSLTAEERRDINAWINEMEGTNRPPSQFVRSDYIAQYFARNTE